MPGIKLRSRCSGWLYWRSQSRGRTIFADSRCGVNLLRQVSMAPLHVWQSAACDQNNPPHISVLCRSSVEQDGQKMFINKKRTNAALMSLLYRSHVGQDGENVRAGPMFFDCPAFNTVPNDS